MIAVDIDATREFSFPGDTSVFILGMLDSGVRALLLNAINRNASDALALRDLVRFGLKGWRNFPDKHGKEIKFETEEQFVMNIGSRIVVKDSCLDRLRQSKINQLANEIIKDNFPQDDDKKK